MPVRIRLNYLVLVGACVGAAYGAVMIAVNTGVAGLVFYGVLFGALFGAAIAGAAVACAYASARIWQPQVAYPGGAFLGACVAWGALYLVSALVTDSSLVVTDWILAGLSAVGCGVWGAFAAAHATPRLTGGA